jgi:DNA-binding IscR family transcriptional regulator
MTDHMATQYTTRILHCLRGGPKTCREIAAATHLTPLHANTLLLELAKKQLIHAPRCAPGLKGVPVNLWELKIPKDETP